MTASRSTSTRSVLVADDDTGFLVMAREILDDAGFRCSLVTSGHAASRELRERPHDVLLADIHMPGNELLELLEEAAAVGVPAVIVTGDPSVETAVASLRAGAVDYVAKPFAPQELLEAIERAVKRARLKENLQESVDLIRTVFGGLAHNAGPLLSSSTDAPSPTDLDGLSNREREVAALFCEAKSPGEIADALALSESTVRNHLKAIYRKLGVHSQLELFIKLRGDRN